MVNAVVYVFQTNTSSIVAHMGVVGYVMHICLDNDNPCEYAPPVIGLAFSIKTNSSCCEDESTECPKIESFNVKPFRFF